MPTTTNYSWTLPTVGASEDAWGTNINTVFDAVDTLLGGTNATEFAILDGATVTTSELNKLAGLATTAAELGYVGGVTSAIQTQLNAKQALDATLTALAGLSTGANKVPYSTGTDTFGQLDFKDEDTMSSDSATAVPSQQSVKAYVDGKQTTRHVSTAVTCPAQNATITVAHGFGVVPDRVTFRLICTSTDLGFSAGDVLYFGGTYFEAQFGSGFNVSADTTNSKVRRSNYQLNLAYGSTYSALNYTKWNIEVISEKFA